MKDTKTIPIDSVIPNDWNDNVMGEDMFEHLGLTMSRFGNLQPILVWDRRKSTDYSGKMIIVDGEHRWRAAKDNGDTEISCVIIDDKYLIEIGQILHEAGLLDFPMPKDIDDDMFRSIAGSLTMLMNDIKGQPDPIKRAQTFEMVNKKLTVPQMSQILKTPEQIIESHKTLLSMDEEAIEAHTKVINQKSATNQVTLFLNEEEFDVFQEAIKKTDMKDHTAGVMFMARKFIGDDSG